MGDRYEELLAEMRLNPLGRRFDELVRLAKHFGCRVTAPGSGSSHYTFSHPKVRGWHQTVKRERPEVKAFYVKKIVKLIDDSKEV